MRRSFTVKLRLMKHVYETQTVTVSAEDDDAAIDRAQDNAQFSDGTPYDDVECVEVYPLAFEEE